MSKKEETMKESSREERRLSVRKNAQYLGTLLG